MTTYSIHLTDKHNNNSLSLLSDNNNDQLTSISTSNNVANSSTMNRLSFTTIKHKYKNFIINEQKWLIPLLDSIRNITIFLPGRFTEHGQLRSETIYTILNLLQVYHDKILHRVNNNQNNEYNIHNIDINNQRYRSVKRYQNILTFLYTTEVLFEMISIYIQNRYIDNNNILRQKFKWYIILLIELIKLYSKFRIFQYNNYSTLTHRTQQDIIYNNVQNNIKYDLDDYNIQKQTHNITNQIGDQLIQQYIQQGRYIHTHGNYTYNSKKQNDVNNGNNNFNDRIKKIQQLCEILYMIRPLIYVSGQLGIMHNSNANNIDDNSNNTNLTQQWKPFISSLLCDLISLSLYTSNIQSLTTQQQTEYKRRITLLLYYLFRSPLYEYFTIRPITTISNILSYIPIFGIIFGNIADITNLFQRYYFYTAASA